MHHIKINGETYTPGSKTTGGWSKRTKTKEEKRAFTEHVICVTYICVCIYIYVYIHIFKYIYQYIFFKGLKMDRKKSEKENKSSI